MPARHRERMSAADSTDAFHVFFHTNRRLRSPPSTRGLVMHSGWWADTHNMRPFEKGTRESKFKREEFPFHARFASHQAFKYQWLSGLAAAEMASSLAAAPWPQPWLLMDTDTVVQCSGAEMRARFEAFGSPLVIGGEFAWWPKRDRQHNPWAAQPSGIRYPNSGMVMGTRAGYEALERAFRAMPRYPCCAKFANGQPTGHCHIDDQHCLQTALMLNSAAQLPWALDTNASLFLNLLGVRDGDLEARDGRCVSGPPHTMLEPPWLQRSVRHWNRHVCCRCFYKPTGRAPCVLHSNGKMAKPKMATVFGCKPDDAWIVPAGKAGAAGGVAAARGNLTAQRQAAALLFPTTH